MVAFFSNFLNKNLEKITILTDQPKSNKKKSVAT